MLVPSSKIIAEINAALARGTKHYSKAGRFLSTERDILDALLEDGEIRFEPRKSN